MIRLCVRVKCDIPHNYSGIGTCNGMQVVSRARRSRRERLTRETRMQVGCPVSRENLHSHSTILRSKHFTHEFHYLIRQYFALWLSDCATDN